MAAIDLLVGSGLLLQVADGGGVYGEIHLAAERALVQHQALQIGPEAVEEGIIKALLGRGAGRADRRSGAGRGNPAEALQVVKLERAELQPQRVGASWIPIWILKG
ncbi:hypothetical protein MesoLj131a_66270 (plasmid) [Mesorhizobium sp. 131-2-1]|nr:hypothetical protein MesoLj131a_66270 [Mesorhizobium sp. 131-2-1]